MTSIHSARWLSRAAGSAHWQIAWLVGLGLFGLAIGSLVYLTDRDGVHAALIPSVAALAGVHLFGAAGLWLPSLMHTFAFSLFTAATLPFRSTWRYVACATWFAIDAVFEWGQHPSIKRELGAAIENLLGAAGSGHALANYFVQGSFDGADIAAAAVGAMAAAAVLLPTQRHLENENAT